MNVAEKVRMAHQLDRLGVDIIEAGFPIASEGDFEAVRALAREIRRPIIAALARSSAGDIERAGRALEGADRARIHTFLATSDIHLQHKLKMSRRQCLEQARDGVKLARTFCKDVQFSAEDASRTDITFLCEVLEAVIEAGATTLNIPDTVGFSVPHEFAELMQTLRRRVKGIEGVTISVHCHDDLGLSVANSLAAIGAGARQVECTVNGIGERAGNTSLEELVMVMRVRAEHYPYQTGVVAGVATNLPVKQGTSAPRMSACVRLRPRVPARMRPTDSRQRKSLELACGPSQIALGERRGRHAASGRATL